MQMSLDLSHPSEGGGRTYPVVLCTASRRGLTEAQASRLAALIRLPLGKHPETDRMGGLLDEHGDPVSEPFMVLRRHPLADPGMLKIEDATPDPPQSVPEPPEAVAPMVEGCALLRGLVDKAARTHHLKHTERLALLYTLGHCGRAGQAYIHQVIALCGNYAPRVTERWIQRMEEGHPAIRCAKLKEWLQDYLPGVACTCPQIRKRPSPLDWLSAGRRTTAGAPVRPQVSEADWKPVADDLFDYDVEDG